MARDKQDEKAWRRPIQEPTITRETGPMEGDLYQHPAYGQIQANRVSGNASLYGSDFEHNGYVTVAIRRSELKRSLSTDWPFAREELIEVAMSESQWAHFVSAMNTGQGAQCTIQHINRETIPGLPRPVDRRDQFGAELKENVREALERLQKLTELIGASGLSGKKQKELMDQVHYAQRDITGSQKFVADMFDEHMEVTVDKAKAEVHAYMNRAISTMGLQAIEALKSKPMIELPEEPPESL